MADCHNHRSASNYLFNSPCHVLYVLSLFLSDRIFLYRINHKGAGTLLILQQSVPAPFLHLIKNIKILKFQNYTSWA